MSKKGIMVRRLSPPERRQLEEMFRDPPDTRVHERALAIKLSSAGEDTGTIAQVIGRSRISIWRWIRDFNNRGLEALYMGKSSGVPPKADEEVYAAVRQAIDTNPRELGYPFTRWTAHLLTEHIRRAVHVHLSIGTMYRILHQLDYRYIRPKLDLKHKQEPTEVQRAKRQKKAAKKKSKPAPVKILWRFSTRLNSISTPN